MKNFCLHKKTSIIYLKLSMESLRSRKSQKKDETGKFTIPSRNRQSLGRKNFVQVVINLNVTVQFLFLVSKLYFVSEKFHKNRKRLSYRFTRACCHKVSVVIIYKAKKGNCCQLSINQIAVFKKSQPIIIYIFVSLAFFHSLPHSTSTCLSFIS